MCKSKLHRARVTETNLRYEGSLTLDPELMEAADLLPHERVQVVNLRTGERLETYVIPGARGMRQVCLNGGAAHCGQVGDEILVISYAIMEEEKARQFRPTLLLCDEVNQIVGAPASAGR